uniref:Uncharacterized protein n=1 Tax=Parascaris univalens TaxID=6257 RepID=A0A914ZV83_PARUN
MDICWKKKRNVFATFFFTLHYLSRRLICMMKMGMKNTDIAYSCAVSTLVAEALNVLLNTQDAGLYLKKSTRIRGGLACAFQRISRQLLFAGKHCLVGPLLKFPLSKAYCYSSKNFRN